MVLKWNKQFEYPTSTRSLINNKRHYAIGEEKLPSVTTILGATTSSEKQESLKKWIDKVGEKEAERVKTEVTLAYPGLYAGATDLCGIYMGRESIIDFKQSNKPKKIEWIEDYKLQGAAYATAHDDMFGTSIEQIVILMCTPDCFFQKFIINGKEFREYKWKWLERVSRYYELQSKESTTNE